MSQGGRAVIRGERTLPEGHTRAMRNPAITVIVPLYNGAPFIEEALNSVLAQTRPPARILVIDDGSTDGGPDIVRDMAGRHDIALVRKENGGQASARNLGVSLSRTPLVAFLDQDDIWYPDHLSELAVPFQTARHPQLGWVYSNLDEIDRDGMMVTRACLDRKPEIEHPKRSLTGCLTTDMFILPTSCLIDREAFLRVGGFDERLVGYEDDDLFLRMFRYGYDNVYLRGALAKWRIYSSSASYSPSMARSRMIYFRKLVEMFSGADWRNVNYVRELIAPRFCPWLLLEYKRALVSPRPSDLTTAVEDLRFLAMHLPNRSRAVFRIMMPMLAWRPTARIAEALIDTELKLVNLRLLKTIVRRILGLPRAGSPGRPATTS